MMAASLCISVLLQLGSTNAIILLEKYWLLVLN
jgi:hypothetical protein